MNRMKAFIWIVISAGVVGLSLLVMLGLFWVIDIAPLILFIGMAVTYGILSARRPQPVKPPVALQERKRSDRR